MSFKLIAKAKRLLAEEWRVFPEDRGGLAPGQKGRLSVALAFPNRYYTAMSNLGFQTVFRLLNQQAETSCERVFLPDPEDIEEYQRTETPLFSLESQRSLRSFDALAFSISYENDFPFLLQMLEMGKISIRREERTPSDPLIIAGGAPILMNPEPLADFVDLFVIGEAEDLVAPLAATLLQAKEKGWSRERLLAGLAEIEGMYVPGFYEVRYHPDGTIAAFEPRGDYPRTIKRIWLPDLNSSLTVSSVLTPHTELSSMFLVELSRGCPRGCRFCAGCYAYFPYRLRRPALLTEALRGQEAAQKIGLVGAAISDYPALVPLGREILKEKKNISFSSLRVDSLTDEVADLVRDSGQKTVTIAPDGGSERMRRVIGKGFGEEEILRAAEGLADRGVRSFRLYFMVGLPWETAEDVRAIVDLTRRIQHHIRKRSKGQKGLEKIMISLNSFVPKPGTPFQWHPLAEVKSLTQKIRAIKNGLRGERGVSVAADLPKWAYLQTLLSRGDRRVGKLLLSAHHLKGNWPQVFHSVDINPDFYVYRERRYAEVLPWDFIVHGIGKERLWEEYEKARKEGVEGSRVQGVE